MSGCEIILAVTGKLVDLCSVYFVYVVLEAESLMFGGV
jgi:hypothetical protein